MVASDFVQKSDRCRVNTVRNKVVLGGGDAWIFIHAGECICNMIVFSRSMSNGIGKGHNKVLPLPNLLAVRCSFHEVQ